MMKEMFYDSFPKSITYIHEVKIFNEIQNNKKIILFDFRKRDEYEAGHINLSINIPYDEHDKEFYETLDERKLLKLSTEYTKCDEIKARLKSYKRYFIGLIFSQEKIKKSIIENLESAVIENDLRERIIKSLLFYKCLQKNGVREIGLFNHGMNTFYEYYKFLVETLDRKPLIQDIGSFPSDVLDHRIFVGNQRDATSEDVIKYLNITHIINITQHITNKFQDKGIKYLNIEIDDTAEFKISKYFKIAYEFIEEALNNNNSSMCNDDMVNSTSIENLKTNLEGNTPQDDQINEDFKDNKKMDELSPKLFPNALQNLGIISLNSWKQMFEKTSNILIKNKILQIVFKNISNTNQTLKNTRVLIHCSLGASRSPSMAIMYIMKKFKVSFDDAFSLVLLHREKSDPIDSFLDELREFENNGYEFFVEDK